MRVYMSDDTQAYCLQWNTTLPSGEVGAVDVRRFQQLLAEHPQTVFDDIEMTTTWGLLVLVLSGRGGSVTQSLNLDLLCLTNDLVVNNQGQLVHRYEKVVEELFLRAKKKLEESKPLQLH